ncbi:MAG TPA: hypothetical protein VHC63_12915 [Acidimicrobiales bacterium]|nr:hypothetical protein [Acidimicrobiales bacterium]
MTPTAATLRPPWTGVLLGGRLIASPVSGLIMSSGVSITIRPKASPNPRDRTMP